MNDSLISFYVDKSKVTEPGFLDLQLTSDFLSQLPAVVEFGLDWVVSKEPKVQDYISNWRPKLAFLLALAEGASLTKYRASMSERMFGLKRAPLSRFGLVLSLIELSILPLLKGKTKENIVALNALYRLLFLFGYTKYWSPLQHIAGIKIVRGSLPSSGSTLLSVLYLVQLMQWLHANKQSFIPVATFNPPPPPEKAGLAGKHCSIPVDPLLCPLCKLNRANPTTITTGYVFCFKCIDTFVKQHHCCPITAQEVSEVRRVY